MKQILFIIAMLLLEVVPLRAQWTSLQGQYGCYGLSSFYTEGDTIYISCYPYEIYKSGDDGHTWSMMPVNLPTNFYNFQGLLYKKNNLVFIAAEAYQDDAIFFSSDYGKTYSNLIDSGSNYSVVELNNYIYISQLPYRSTDVPSLIRSNDGGKTWENILANNKIYLYNLQSFGSSLYAFGSHSQFNNDWQICRSKDGGFTWDSLFGFHTKDSRTLPIPSMFTPFYGRDNDTNIWVAVDTSSNNRIIRTQLLYNISLRNDTPSVYKFPFVHTFDTTVTSMLLYNKTLSATTINNVYLYNPNSDSWEAITDKLSNTGVGLYYPVSKNSNDFLLTLGDLYRCSPHSSTPVISDTGITNYSTTQLFLYHDTLLTISSAVGGPTFFSTDQGNSWMRFSLPVLNNVNSFWSTPKGLIYTSNNTLILRTGNALIQSVLENSIGTFLRSGDKYYCQAVDSALRFFRSDDSGVTWIKTSKVPTQYGGGASTAVGNLIFFGAWDGILVSYDSCMTWNSVKTFPASCEALGALGTILYAEGDTHKDPVYQMYKSLDSGITWIPIGLKRDQSFRIILPIRNNILMGGDGGIYRCNPDGLNFIFISNDYALRYCTTFETDSQYLYVGTNFRGIFRAKLDDVLNYTNGVSKPIQFENISVSLYPNPAENSLTIESSKNLSNANYTLFDQLGRSMLHRDALDFTKDNKINLDVSNLSSGTYFLRLESNGFSGSQKVVIYH